MIKQYQPSFGDEERIAVNDYMASGGWLTENIKTIEFENEISKFLNVQHSSCVSNGTISLSIALLAVDIKPNDKVIVPDVTMIATANAVTFIGAKPIFIDVSYNNLCLDLLETKIAILNDPEIKAVIYVSLNGRSHTLEELNDLKSFLHTHNVALIEDAAQSFSSKVQDKFLGTIGDIGSYSLSPHKIISTGQGGILVTDNNRLHEKIERLKDFGRLHGGSDIHEYFGINSKFTDLQSVIGTEQLKKINSRIAFKKELYTTYRNELCNISSISMIEPNSDTVPWFIDIYINNRQELIDFLASKDIETRPLYPALHTQKLFANLDRKYSISAATHMSNRGLWLPSSFNLKNEDILKICNTIKEFYQAP